MSFFPTIDRERFRGIVQWSSGPVSVDVLNVARTHFGLVADGFHRCIRCVALGMWLRQMMRIGGSAVTKNLCEDWGVSFASIFQRLERKHGRSFAEGQAIAIPIEWLACCR